MTPLENADKLIKLFEVKIFTPEKGWFIDYEETYKLALICVNELISDCDASSPYEVDRLKYWREVESIIELRQIY